MEEVVDLLRDKYFNKFGFKSFRSFYKYIFFDFDFGFWNNFFVCICLYYERDEVDWLFRNFDNYICFNVMREVLCFFDIIIVLLL